MNKVSVSNRKFVYAFLGPHSSINVVNYDATNNHVNTFLSLFDIWGCGGVHKMSIDDNHQEVWFELNKSFLPILKRKDFKEAFRRMGVELVFDYPYDTY